MKTPVLPAVRLMSEIEISQAQIRTAMKSQTMLIEWLEKSGRRWVTFNSRHLVDALPWPEGVESFMQIVAAYRDHRSILETGDVETIKNPDGTSYTKSVLYGETLHIAELDRCIRYLIGQASNLDPDWSLEGEPL